MPDCVVIFERLQPEARIPLQAHSGDAAFDLFTPVDGSVPVHRCQRVPLGFRMELERGWEAQIWGRSGLAANGIIPHLGTIDADYRGEVCVILFNVCYPIAFHFRAGDRIAQLKIRCVPEVVFKEGSVNIDTERAASGFGSTGK